MNRSQWIELVLLLALIFPVSAFAQIPPATDPDDELIYVRQRVSTDYEDSTQALKKSLRAPLEKSIEVQPGDTLSGVISRNYRVGQSNAPSTYKALESYISEMNSMASTDHIQSGSQLQIPDLPPIAKSNPSTSNKNNRVAKLSIQDGLNDEDIRRIKLFDAWRSGAKEVVQWRLITRREARLIQSTGQSKIDVANAKVNISLADTTEISSAEFLSQSDSNLIRSELKKEAYKKPILFILDDGWPDSDSFIESKAILIDAIRKIREKYHMGSPEISKSLESAKQIQYSKPSEISCISKETTTAAGSKNHAAMIKRSLQPLEELEPPQGRVRIVYIPVFVSQIGSCDILRELIEINLISRHMKSVLGDHVPPDVQKTSKILAINILKGVKNSTQSNLLGTDQAVIEAVLKFCKLYADLIYEPYLLNMSWTVPNLEFEPFIPPDAYGISVVAAGNEGDLQGTTVYKLKRQFAYRSRFPGDMLAVMNINSDGSPSCDSSLLDVQPDIYGFSFPGKISDSECGTSFSAPRVAWLIAAKESISPKAISIEDWKSQTRQNLLGMRDMQAKGFNRILLDIPKLFDKPTQ